MQLNKNKIKLVGILQMRHAQCRRALNLSQCVFIEFLPASLK